ncbi:DUF72 domain-containing protein [Rosettibacter firmus]|uniref:DUF72 domain-containing protein n=1 Tax=Rosettibacter firmus TaxID=3111522 RepID=UPI00336BFD05
MNKEIRVGCCGFPVSHKKYFQVFNCIEINITFYQIPEINTALKWKEESQSYNKDFEFIIKAWQLITHPASSFTYRRLKEKIPENRKKYCGYFQPSEEVFNAWERTKEFAEKLDCNKILFQTPSSFKPTEENKNNLINFFNYINKSKRYHFIWEARGNWSIEEIKEICKKLNLTHCVDPLSPNLNNSVHGKFNYFRIHGNYTGNKINYNYKIDNEAMKKVFLSCDRNINYVMFNNSYMFEDALTFMKNYI